MLKFLLAVTFALASAVDLPIFPGACRTVDDFGGAHTGNNGFNVTGFLGVWWEIERYEEPFQAGGECVSAQYTIHGELPGVRVTNTKRNIANSVWQTDIGRAVPSFPDENPVRGMLNVTFPDTAPTPVSNYWILRTDYFDYAVVVACVPLNATHHRDLYWFMSRGYPASTNARNRTNEIINTHLNREYIRPTLQEIGDCFL